MVDVQQDSGRPLEEALLEAVNSMFNEDGSFLDDAEDEEVLPEEQHEAPEVVEMVLSDPAEEPSSARNAVDTPQQSDTNMANTSEGNTKDEEKHGDTVEVTKIEEAMEDADAEAATHNDILRRRTTRRGAIETFEEDEYVATSPQERGRNGRHERRTRCRIRYRSTESRRRSRSPSVECPRSV
jgi:hypothetical protein